VEISRDGVLHFGEWRLGLDTSPTTGPADRALGPEDLARLRKLVADAELVAVEGCRDSDRSTVEVEVDRGDPARRLEGCFTDPATVRALERITGADKLLEQASKRREMLRGFFDRRHGPRKREGPVH